MLLAYLVLPKEILSIVSYLGKYGGVHMIHGLGERLKSQRELKKLSQKQVAEIINVSASIVSNYENGERTPSLEILVALARTLNCSTDYLLGFEKLENDKVLDVSMLSDEQRLLLQHFLYGLKK